MALGAISTWHARSARISGASTSSKMRPLVLFALAAVCDAAVIGIDFGARFLKVGIIAPGKGIELVLNEASKRKSSAAAGFNSQKERVYGDDSYNLMGKLPAQQYVLQKLLLGKAVSSAEVASFTDVGFPYEFETDDATNAAVIKYGTNETLRSEELVAFVLSYAKQLGEASAGAPVKDCVITIPPFFGTSERTAMLSAASIAGLNVLSLVHENTAFAFKYGFDKEADFSLDEPTNVVFADLGASSFKVSLVSFSSVAGKKNKTSGTMAVKGVAWDSSLGGRDFDHVVLEMLADAFMKAYPTVSDIRSSVRAMGKLRKESERVKDTLSANKMFQVGIESLHEDRDLRIVVNRAEFEERAAALWPRFAAPMRAVLEQANLTAADVHKVEMVGGATRIPRVKDTLNEVYGLPISASLNGDEAAALGATLFAAKLSTSFRLREFAITDAFPHPIAVKLGSDGEAADADSASDEGEGKPQKGKWKLLFKANTKFPHKKLITMSRVDDLVVSLANGDPADPANLQPISTFNITGVGAALTRMTKPTSTPVGKPKVSVTFALSGSGLLEVTKAEVAIEVLEEYEDVEVVPLNETELAALNETEADADAEANATDAEAVLEAEDAAANATGASNATNATNATKVKTKTVPVTKERKRIHYATLKAAETLMLEVQPLGADGRAACVKRNLEMLEAERERRLIAEAKNAVESFVIDTRDKLSSDDDVEKVSTEEVR